MIHLLTIPLIILEFKAIFWLIDKLRSWREENNKPDIISSQGYLARHTVLPINICPALLSVYTPSMSSLHYNHKIGGINDEL